MAASVYVLLLTLTLLAVHADDNRMYVHITYDEKTHTYHIQEGHPTSDSLATATFINSVNETGWALLEVATWDAVQTGYDDSMKAYAAGLAEGYISRELIGYHWENTQAGYCEEPYSPYCQRLRNFLEENLNWIKTSITANKGDPYWHQVEMFYTQLKGLEDGYNSNPTAPSLDIDLLGLYLFQISDDVGDLEVLLQKPGLKNGPRPGHCSALVKFLPDIGEVMVAHNTWTNYKTMLRVLKKYSLRYSKTGKSKEDAPGFTWTFSSYPGYLVSSDDFHMLSSGMVSLETTNPNNNPSLYKHTTPEGCLFEPVRVWTANRLATSGREWVQNFTLFNSGTYNNQWMVVDQKLASTSTGGQLPEGVLTIVEQLPGFFESADVTDVLRKEGYWSSYNVAYFPTVFNMSGQQPFVEKYGDYFTHDQCRRAQIFRRDQHTVKDKETLFKLMSYNDFKNDPLSRCNCTPPYSADLAIAARHDLNSETGTYTFDSLGYEMEGAVDVKMMITSEMWWLLFDAISGPTYQQQPPFQWSKVKDSYKYKHYGQPDLFKFKPIVFNGTENDSVVSPWYKET